MRLQIDKVFINRLTFFLSQLEKLINKQTYKFNTGVVFSYNPTAQLQCQMRTWDFFLHPALKFFIDFWCLQQVFDGSLLWSHIQLHTFHSSIIDQLKPQEMCSDLEMSLLSSLNFFLLLCQRFTAFHTLDCWTHQLMSGGLIPWPLTINSVVFDVIADSFAEY